MRSRGSRPSGQRCPESQIQISTPFPTTHVVVCNLFIFTSSDGGSVNSAYSRSTATPHRPTLIHPSTTSLFLSSLGVCAYHFVSQFIHRTLPQEIIGRRMGCGSRKKTWLQDTLIIKGEHVRRGRNTWRRSGRRRKQWGWKARWTSIREGKREWGKRRKTAEESIHSTTESVRKTPINNNTQFHRRRRVPIQKSRRNRERIKGGTSGGCAYFEPGNVQYLDNGE